MLLFALQIHFKSSNSCMKLWVLRISSAASSLKLVSSLVGTIAGVPDQQSTRNTETSIGMPQRTATANQKNGLDFWMTDVYRTEDAHPALHALVPPNELLEFYHEGVPLTIKEKSFLFACVVGLGPTLMTPSSPKLRELRMLQPRSGGGPPIFDSMTIERLSAFHALDCIHRKSLVVSDVSLFRHLTYVDRMQFLRELSSPECVREMESSRWFYLDVAEEAATLSIRQLQISVLVDMSMLLQLPWESNAIDVQTVIASLAMIFLSMEGESEADCRAAYFLVQHTFQAFRCQLFSDGAHVSPTGLRAQLYSQFLGSILAGWARLIGPWPAPPLTNAVSADALMISGLWPLLLNPFKLSGRRWSKIRDQSPYRAYLGHEYLESSPFSLDPTFCAWPVGTGREPPHKWHLAALELHVAREFARLPEGPSHRLPLARDATISMTPPMDCDLQSTMDLVAQNPNNLLQGITWPAQDPKKLGLRARVALAVCCGLVKGYPSQRKVRCATDYLLSVICDGSILVTLTKSCPQCFCAQTHRSLPSREKALRRVCPFSIPVTKNVMQKEFSSISGGINLVGGYDQEDIPAVMEALRISEPIEEVYETRASHTTKMPIFRSTQERLQWIVNNRPASTQTERPVIDKPPRAPKAPRNRTTGSKRNPLKPQSTSSTRPAEADHVHNKPAQSQQNLPEETPPERKKIPGPQLLLRLRAATCRLSAEAGDASTVIGTVSIISDGG